MRRLIIMLIVSVLSAAFFIGGYSTASGELLQNRYVNTDMQVISYDVFLDREVLGDAAKYAEIRKQLGEELTQNFLARDRGTSFQSYIIDMIIMPVREGDPPRVMELNRKQLEEFLSQ